MFSIYGTWKSANNETLSKVLSANMVNVQYLGYLFTL